MVTDSKRHKGLRKTLTTQLREKGIRDEKVLKAIETVPRHYFFEKAFLEYAYQDHAFPIGEGQTISQPYTVAFQTELLELKSTDKVLEIGTGSGYQCCILLEMTPNVFTIEYNQNLYKKALLAFKDLNQHPHAFCGDGSEGLAEYAPYNKILVTAGAPSVPKALLAQLSIGGILVIPVGDASSQKMLRIRKLSETDFIQEELDNFMFVPLLGKSGWN